MSEKNAVSPKEELRQLFVKDRNADELIKKGQEAKEVKLENRNRKAKLISKVAITDYCPKTVIVEVFEKLLNQDQLADKQTITLSLNVNARELVEEVSENHVRKTSTFNFEPVKSGPKGVSLKLTAEDLRWSLTKGNSSGAARLVEAFTEIIRERKIALSQYSANISSGNHKGKPEFLDQLLE